MLDEKISWEEHIGTVETNKLAKNIVTRKTFT